LVGFFWQKQAVRIVLKEKKGAAVQILSGRFSQALKASWGESESALGEEADRRIAELAGQRLWAGRLVGRLLVQRGKRRCGKVTGIKRRRQEACKLCKQRTGTVVN